MKDYSNEQTVYWMGKIGDIAQTVTDDNRERVAERIEGIARGILVGKYADGIKAKSVVKHAAHIAHNIRHNITEE